MEQQIFPACWEPYADETEHYSYVRCLDLGKLYEVVRVTHNKKEGQAEFVHQVIFMSEYDEPALAEILRGFGYESLDAYVREVNYADADPSGFIVRQDGSVDREASPAWWIDYMLLASLMAEHFDGRMMAAQAADDLARRIVEQPSEAISPFCIQRTFVDQMMTIPLLDSEVNAICNAKDAQARMAYLCDEISDMDEDDPCFDGCSQSALLNDSALLAAVQRRWYHYNGHGGDHTENLREAVKVAIHEQSSR